MGKQHLLRTILIVAMMTLYYGCTIENITEEAPDVVAPPPVSGPVDTDNDGLSDAQEAMLGTSPLMADTDGDGFDDNSITLVYLADLDRDGMFNREEHLRGTNAASADTDSDGLDDEFEVKTGWLARNGFNEYRVYPDPLSPDADGDSLPDELERQRLTEPNLADTDADGISDLDDNDPTGGESGVRFRLVFSGPGNRVQLSGSVSSDEPLDAVVIDWGDGTAAQPINVNFNNVQATHFYAEKGVFLARVTADRPFGADPVADYRVSLLPTSRTDVGNMTADAGWTETIHKRFVVDINGDGYADLIGFGPDGVWLSVALDSGATFSVAERIVDFLGSDLDAGFSDHIHTLANVGGGPEPEIVVFHDDGVHLATSYGIGFEDQGRILDDYGFLGGWTRNHTRQLAYRRTSTLLNGYFG